MHTLPLRPPPPSSYPRFPYLVLDFLRKKTPLRTSVLLTTGFPRTEVQTCPHKHAARPQCFQGLFLANYSSCVETYPLHNITPHFSPYNIVAYEPLHSFHLGVSKLIKLAAIERLKSESLFTTTGPSHFQRAFIPSAFPSSSIRKPFLPKFNNKSALLASTSTLSLGRTPTLRTVSPPTTAYAVCSKGKTSTLSTRSSSSSAPPWTVVASWSLQLSLPPSSPDTQTFPSPQFNTT